jgi:hypothetical protein
MNTGSDSLYSTQFLINKAGIRGTQSNRGTVVDDSNHKNSKYKKLDKNIRRSSFKEFVYFFVQF